MTGTEYLKGVKVFSFCGIGDPESFLFLLNQLNMEVIELQPFPDHHIYSESEIAELKTKAMNSGATHLVTTEKDWVKLPESDREDGYIRYVPIETVFLNNGGATLEKELKGLF